MPNRIDSGVAERISRRIAELGLTEAGAAKAAGLGASAIRNIRNGSSKFPRLDTVRKLAPTLKVSPEWLAYGDGDEVARAQEETARRPSLTIPVIGEVAAGRWLEIDDFVDEPAFAPVSINPDRRWPAEHQYGLVVRGESLNRFAIDGDVLACVDATATNFMPRTGNLIIVEMRRAAGLLRQRTAKRFLPRDTHVELWPDSDHPRWQKPIIIPKALTALEYFMEDEDGRIDVTVSAFVLSAVRPVQRWRPPPAVALVEAEE